VRRQVNLVSWKLGDRIRVRAERIDPMRRRVEFAVVVPVAASVAG
jgi:hypothetical protein